MYLYMYTSIFLTPRPEQGLEELAARLGQHQEEPRPEKSCVGRAISSCKRLLPLGSGFRAEGLGF